MGFAWMMPTLSRICGRPCLIFSAFISRKNNEIFRNKVSFCFLVNSLPQFCPKTVPFFFLSESSKCLNYLFCMSNLRFEISWKKSAKTIGNSCFCRINHLLAVWKSAMMDNTHDQVQNILFFWKNVRFSWVMCLCNEWLFTEIASCNSCL